MRVEFIVKLFGKLTKEELYEILRVRAQTFVVNLKMNCQDLDGKDFDATHFYLCKGGKIYAYLRAFYLDDSTIKIGRVLSVEQGKGVGTKFVKSCIAYIKENMPCKSICLDSQKGVVGFYEKLGFITVSDEFLEEGVLHVKMEFGDAYYK